ncbi:WavE lipopolysaccharide synthesis family protein [Vibrio ezurae]|uniref:WavE lipopolysaccharide synthesis n=1 Tax=Vibrio ezurae NBRC 102218 TaxID=1219080 RepID=U3CH57_9VIBR|nr:WavE lipopolysaccharide synthesis family protein [Vibrio ezurae]GAD80544.1 hypothetical protein VEZ01S_37_01090 [Vibrio ezurae NBRC 102218]
MFKDISVVVQGPVQALVDRNQEEGITQRCLRSVREHLPGAKIILSTWYDQDLDGLDYDELVLCQDPGHNIRQYNRDGSPHYFNNNRQIVSTAEGLKKVKTKYAVKLRSDNYLTNNDFVEYQKKYDVFGDAHRYFNQRVVVSDIFTRKFAKGLSVPLHISDFFYFGLTSDLLSLWDLPLEKDYIPSQALPFDASDPYHLVDCTQLFVLKSLKKIGEKFDLKHLHDKSIVGTKISEEFIANNLIILGETQLGLGLPSKFKGNTRVSKLKGKCSHYQFFEWELLYKKYSYRDYKVEIDFFYLARIHIARLCYIYPRSLETIFNIYKRKYFRGLS